MGVDPFVARRFATFLSGLILLLAPGTAATEPRPAPVLAAMQQELERSMKALTSQPVPPYYLAYEITEAREITVRGSYGTILESDDDHSRWLDIDLRVGSYELDNTHPIRTGPFDFPRRQPLAFPLGDDVLALRSVLWYRTDEAYRRAVERLTQIETNVQVKVEEEDRSGDFSRETPQRHLQEGQALQVDRATWESKVRTFTAPFAEHADILEANAWFSAETTWRWLVSSEGAEIQTSQRSCRLLITAMTKAEDGMELPRYESFYAETPEELPDDATILAAVQRMVADLAALRVAPVVDPYTGPAILSGRAGGVFFHEVLGHRIEGHRQKDEDESQTFKKKIGEAVLPPIFSVVFDPTRTSANGSYLAGNYTYDNEGVGARPVAAIRKGVLEGFLMSRSPVAGFPSSNGHGRRQRGFPVVARQSNLFVEVETRCSAVELTAKLLDLVKQEGKPFGLRFEDVQGGFTMTGRTIPNAFNVLPILVYRVYPDGKEELVRGVDLIGTPLTAFSQIIAADDEIDVFNGHCGAESGSVPVSAICPGILVRQIEVQKKSKSEERAPILPAPGGGQP